MEFETQSPFTQTTRYTIPNAIFYRQITAGLKQEEKRCKFSVIKISFFFVSVFGVEQRKYVPGMAEEPYAILIGIGYRRLLGAYSLDKQSQNSR